MSQAIIITGMGRSGTSLITSLMQRAGTHVGEKLLAASSANPRGYFEDVDFFEFHDHRLHERGQTYLHIDSDFAFEPTAAEAEQARQLLAARSHRPVWGWKDPRTTLFLPFWQQLLPEARFLFVYRHPIEVLLSLLRRGEFDNHPSFMAGLNAWHTYNTKILNFCDQYPSRCLLVHVDGVVQEPAKFSRLLQEKLQLDLSLDPQAFEQIYHANELKKTTFPPQLSTTLARLYPGLLDLYQQLNLQADLPANAIQTDPAASPHWSPLAHFAESLAEPISLPVQHSLLQLLLWLLAPEPTGKAIARFNFSTKEIQQEVDQLWLHSQHLHRLNVEKGQELERLQQLKVEQEQELQRLQQLKAEQGQELERRQKLAAEQEQELERLEQLSAQQSQTLDCLQWLNLQQNQELEQQSVRIESLAAELDSIRGTRIWKAVQSYRNLKDRIKKAA